MTETIELRRVSALVFDPQNPRLPRSVDGRDEQAVLAWMLDDSTIIELMESIGSQDYFVGEPVLITDESAAGSGTFEVIEGNRRLAALKLLLDPDLAPSRQRAVRHASEEAQFRPDTVPTLKFDSRSDVLDYLGYRHVTGIKEWGPLAKARYISELASRHGLGPDAQDLAVLAKRVGAGKRTDYIKRLLDTLALYDLAYDRDFFGLGLSEDNVEFSILSTALGYRTIATFIGPIEEPDTDAVRDLFSWLFVERQGGRVVAESRRLKELAAVVAAQPALDALRAGVTLDEAHVLTAGPLEAFRQLATSANTNLATAQGQFARVTGVEDSDAELLSEVVRRAEDLLILVRAHLDNDKR